MTAKPKTIVHVSRILQHYREGVLAGLDSNPDFEFSFVADEDSGDERIPTIPMEHFRRCHSVRNIWCGPLLWQKGLITYLHRNRFDIAIFEGDVKHLSTWIGLILLRLQGRPTYLWTIGWHRPDKILLKRFVRKSFYRLASSVLLYGIDGFEIGVSAGFPSSRMKVIGNSYPETTKDSSDIAPPIESKEFDSLDGLRVVGAIVRLNFDKRLDMLLEAVKVLRSEGQKVGVLLTGSGPAEEALQQQAYELGVPLVMTGAAYDSESIERIYDVLEVTVLPERAGLTVMQSMSRGVPVVTVDDPYKQVPEFRAVRHGETGALYSAGDISALARAIDLCLRLVDSDPESLDAHCRKEIEENWSVRAHVRRIENAIQK